MGQRPERLATKIRREEGVTLITAIMAVLVIMILALTVVAMAAHNAQQSGRDRQRVQAIAAAEAGLDYYFAHLSTAGTPQCTLSGTLPTSPPATFTVTSTFYSSAITPLPCPYPAGTAPASVLVRSMGQSGGSSRRTMDALVRLTPVSGGPFGTGGAVFGNSGVEFQANAMIGGDRFNDADVYSNGDISMRSNSVVYGSVYGQGSVTMGSGAEVKEDVWASGPVVLGGNVRIRGDATSSTASISNGAWHVFGSATAATSIGSGEVYGARLPESPSVGPPSRPYPTFSFDPTEWQGAGYTVRTYSDCATAATDIAGWWGASSGNNVVRIAGGCTLTFTADVTVRGNLGVVTDGSVFLPTTRRFFVAAGSGPFNVFMFAGLSSLSECGVTIDPNAGFGAGLDALIYTPPACRIEVRSNSGLASGQIVGGSLVFKHTLAFQYVPADVPGLGTGGFRQDVLYKREVVSQ